MKDKRISKMIASRVRKLRAAHKLSQEALAEAAGLSRDAVSRIERADRQARIETLAQLAEAFSMQLNELLTFDAEVPEIRDEHQVRLSRIGRHLRNAEPWMADRIVLAVAALCTPTAGERRKPPPAARQGSPREDADRGRKTRGRGGKGDRPRGKR
jgi:transcriptional regulator with XRE-family HTH domain